MYELKEYDDAQLPDAQKAIEEARAFASQIEEHWTFVKVFPGGVNTYTHWDGDNYWVARVSEHDTSYEDMVSTLYNNHTAHEAEYIGMIESQRPLEVSESGSYASNIVTYRFPFPLRNRDMVIWSTKKETAPNSQFAIVTLPRKYATQRTKGMYLSVEVVSKLGPNRVKWVMATTSDAGGWLPKMLQRPKLPAAVAEDIPQFMAWLAEWKRSHRSAE